MYAENNELTLGVIPDSTKRRYNCKRKTLMQYTLYSWLLKVVTQHTYQGIIPKEASKIDAWTDICRITYRGTEHQGKKYKYSVI